MGEITNQLIDELTSLSIEIEGLSGPRSDAMLSTISNSAPPLYKSDLARLPQIISKKLESINAEYLDESTLQDLENVLNKIYYTRQTILPGFFNQNQNNVANRVSSFLLIMQWIDTIITPLYNNWESVDENALPKSLAQKLYQTKNEFEAIAGDKENLTSKIDALNQASPIVDDISNKLKDINELETEIKSHKAESTSIVDEININKEIIEKALIDIQSKQEEAELIIKRAGKAYSMATTMGLAGSFDKRAISLKVSMGLWIGGLILALIIGAWIGYQRFEAVQTALKTKIEPSYIWILIFLSILSFGAPIWFAWLATKQIGQRFKLSEDYAFKASVAKAYEGYRKEAASFDKEMEARLFASALTRLDELPLRFMDRETHGSPWQELLNNPSFLKLFKEKPEILDKILDMAKTQLASEKSNTYIPK